MGYSNNGHPAAWVEALNQARNDIGAIIEAVAYGGLSAAMGISNAATARIDNSLNDLVPARLSDDEIAEADERAYAWCRTFAHGQRFNIDLSDALNLYAYGIAINLRWIRRIESHEGGVTVQRI